MTIENVKHITSRTVASASCGRGRTSICTELKGIQQGHPGRKEAPMNSCQSFAEPSASFFSDRFFENRNVEKSILGNLNFPIYDHD